MVGHRPLEASILVRVQVWQQKQKEPAQNESATFVLLDKLDENRGDAKPFERSKNVSPSGGRANEIFMSPTDEIKIHESDRVQVWQHESV